jgi:hypothetical protein
MNKRISNEKQALVLATLCEGTPINGVSRIFRTGKHAVLGVIRETGEAFADYMDIWRADAVRRHAGASRMQ